MPPRATSAHDARAGARGGIRTHTTFRPPAPKTGASANSATLARNSRHSRQVSARPATCRPMTQRATRRSAASRRTHPRLPRSASPPGPSAALLRPVGARRHGKWKRLASSSNSARPAGRPGHPGRAGRLHRRRGPRRPARRSGCQRARGPSQGIGSLGLGRPRLLFHAATNRRKRRGGARHGGAGPRPFAARRGRALLAPHCGDEGAR